MPRRGDGQCRPDTTEPLLHTLEGHLKGTGAFRPIQELQQPPREQQGPLTPEHPSKGVRTSPEPQSRENQCSETDRIQGKGRHGTVGQGAEVRVPLSVGTVQAWLGKDRGQRGLQRTGGAQCPGGILPTVERGPRLGGKWVG